MHAKSLSCFTLLCLTLDQSLCSYVDEYKLWLMPIVTDNRAYVQCYTPHVDDNAQQMSGWLRVFIGLHPPSTPDTPRGPFLSISRQHAPG